MIYIGADHRGFALKEVLKNYLKELGFELEDLGAYELNPVDDYPDFALLVAQKVAENPTNNRGILICGSGHGMDMVANKHKSVRAALVFNEAVAKQSREHEDSNILVLASDWIEEESTKKIIKTWLETKFDGAERNVRRTEKIKKIEEENFK